MTDFTSETPVGSSKYTSRTSLTNLTVYLQGNCGVAVWPVTPVTLVCLQAEIRPHWRVDLASCGAVKMPAALECALPRRSKAISYDHT
jgi:hypothetical protein